MSILTDDERREIRRKCFVVPGVAESLDAEAYADAVETAVLAKLRKQEPYGRVTVVRRPGCVDQHWFYRWPDPPYLDNAAECHVVYAAPEAPAQPAAQETVKCKYPNNKLTEFTELLDRFIESDFERAERWIESALVKLSRTAKLRRSKI